MKQKTQRYKLFYIYTHFMYPHVNEKYNRVGGWRQILMIIESVYKPVEMLEKIYSSIFTFFFSYYTYSVHAHTVY